MYFVCDVRWMRLCTFRWSISCRSCDVEFPFPTCRISVKGGNAQIHRSRGQLRWVQLQDSLHKAPSVVWCVPSTKDKSPRKEWTNSEDITWRSNKDFFWGRGWKGERSVSHVCVVLLLWEKPPPPPLVLCCNVCIPLPFLLHWWLDIPPPSLLPNLGTWGGQTTWGMVFALTNRTCCRFLLHVWLSFK